MCTALHSLPRCFHSSYLFFPNPDWETRPFHFMGSELGVEIGDVSQGLATSSRAG